MCQCASTSAKLISLSVGAIETNLRRSYRSVTNDIATEFMIPLLSEARFYDRAAGYFTASSFKVLTAGLKVFVLCGGRMRLVISPQLTDEDLEQIIEGYELREEAVNAAIDAEVEKLIVDDEPTANRLAWLIANDVLEIRFATPSGKRAGIYHEKFGIFRNDRISVAFTGSLNETGAALTRNIEYIDVYASWRELDRVTDKINDFERLWNGEAKGVSISGFPKAVKDKLIKIVPLEYLEEQEDAPHGRLQLRGRQEDAVDAWTNNGCRGLLAMATGTGKTFTALGAIQRLFDQDLRTVVILVPQIALANQWAVEAERELRIAPLVCHSQTNWRLKLKTAALLAKTDSVRRTLIISTYDTAQNHEFAEAIKHLPSESLVVADEVHNVSSQIAGDVLMDIYPKRMGLSATPQRWMDEDGTSTLLQYFSGIVYSYTLSEAISDGTLTPYYYYPVVCRENDAQINDPDLPLASNARVSRFEEMFKKSSGYEDGFSLVYCNHQSLKHVLQFLGHDNGLKVHTFTAEESAEERKTILHQFGTGQLHSLVAMRCLDEGIDVPATRSAYLLANSINPKQFVQRRGRVLRRFSGKQSSTIYDFIFLEGISSETKRAQVQNELSRFAEFAFVSLNSSEAVESIRDAARNLGIDLAQFLEGV